MSDLLERYNYEKFVPEMFMPWMRFHESPPLGESAPDFPLWHFETEEEGKLSDIWGSHLYTIVEFGSFT